MCTVIISLKPDSPIPLLVGANRDEDPTRPSEHFGLRDNNSALYPMDVGGGTWIGVNKAGIFAAITNRDDTKHMPKRSSRGKLVLKALQARSIDEISLWADALTPKKFNGFRLIVADEQSCSIWEGNGVSRKVNIVKLSSGLHIITGFGIDTWDISRCKFVQTALCHLDNERYRIEAYDDITNVLSAHQTGKVEDDVCVHDPNESHKTVSSCCIEINRFSHYGDIIVDAVKIAPCLAKEWDTFTIEG